MLHELHSPGGAPPSAEELAELAGRWKRARLSALRNGPPQPGAGPDEHAEVARLQASGDAELRAARRRVFEHSLKLGESFARFRGAPVAPEALPDVLPALGLPCLAGRWEEIDDEPGFRLQRAPCRALSSVALCDHAREAIDGLVLGITGGVRHARHESAGHGSHRCVDVLYGDPRSSLRHGPVPPELEQELELVRGKVARFKRGAELKILGVTEGELLYELVAPGAASAGCGGCGDLLPRFVESSLRTHFPALVPRELSPRPVLDPGGAATPPPREERLTP